VFSDRIAFNAATRHWGAVQKLFELLKSYPGWFAVIAGAISATGFAPLGHWPLTALACALLLHLVAVAASKGAAFRIGWLFGLGHFGIGLNWLAGSFRYQDAMPVWLGWIAVLAVSFYVAVYPALAALGAYWVGDGVRKRGSKATFPFVLSFAGFWTLTEWLRATLFTGFAWNPLSASQIDTPLSWALPALGSYGVSALVIVFAAILWGLLAGLLAKTGKVIAARIFDLVLLAGACAILSFIGGSEVKPSKTLAPTITIVQPNIGQQDKDEADYYDVNFAKLARYSKPLPGQGPRLLLWPEAAVPDYLEDGYPYRFYQFQSGESAIGARAQLTSLMGPKDILLTGSNRLVIDKKGQLIAARNSMSAMDAKGQFFGHYDKAHLVPYGEYLALRWLLEPLGATRLVPGDLDFLPGPGPQTLALPGFGNVGIQICYEIIFSGHVVDAARRPDFLFNPSNDAWFGTWGPPQHLAQARLRAIEEGLPVIRSTPTGISAIVDAEGRITHSIALGKAGRIDAKLPFAHNPTLFARFGNALPLAFAALLLLLALLPVALRRTSR
jgi:apolipoprotein N-acyltransferase